MIWSTKSLQEALGIAVDNSIETGKLQFNSKDVVAGDLFIALKGNSDGHLYVQDALKRGAAGVIVSHKVDNILDHLAILVDDTKQALLQMANYKRRKSLAKFIGVTGSVGKTSTKEALYAAISSQARTFANRGNFNNLLGVLIELASLPDDIEFAILEMGMNSPGEIEELSKLIKPDIGIITNVSEAHLEFFSNIDEIVDAKCEIFTHMSKKSIAMINADNIHYKKISAKIASRNIKHVSYFGETNIANARLVKYDNQDHSTKLEYEIDHKRVEIKMSYILPKHQAMNFSCCLGVVSYLGLDMDKAAHALSSFNLIKGRGQIITASKQGNKYTIIGDYYNANPASMKAALAHQAQIEHPKKISIIGDMLELGNGSISFHQELVPHIIKAGAQKVLLVGSYVKSKIDLFPKNLYVKQFDNVDILISDLPNILTTQELILIKGSRGIALHKIIDYFDQKE